MNRYRYGEKTGDDSSIEEGDLGFVGVNSFDTPENIKKGQVQDAVNMDFTSSAASSRGGFVCIPALAAAPAGRVWASGLYSDPNAKTVEWKVLAGANSASFHSFAESPRTVLYPGGTVISQVSTIVQANNYVFIFPGEGQTPIRWNGNWTVPFELVPGHTVDGNANIPQSNSATYYQNRLWVVNGKDQIAASDVLDFTEYDPLANDFNLNRGISDYIIRTYPFGENALVVFKHKSSVLLQNVQGSLDDVTSTDITREIGIIGINACVAVGPDLYYMSDRNITSIRLNLQNQLQAVTEPLSRNIKSIMARINWAQAHKVAMAYWDNKLFISLPLDNSTTCNAITCYNFITQEWRGEWSFNASLTMAIQGFLVANYLGAIRLHVVTEDGRIFVTEDGQNDISGTIVCEIASSLTTRPYRSDNNSRINRRMYADIGTNRASLTFTAYSEGASESEVVIANQTYARSQSWLFNDTPYAMSNANNDFNRAFRKDYSSGPDSVQSGTGFLPEMVQNYRLPIITRRKGRLHWFKVSTSQGFLQVLGVGVEARSGDRNSLTQVG